MQVQYAVAQTMESLT